MLNGLNLIEFLLYVGPWIIFAFICLLTMLFMGVKYDFAREHIEELKAKNQYYVDRARRLQRDNTMLQAKIDGEVRK